MSTNRLVRSASVTSRLLALAAVGALCASVLVVFAPSASAQAAGPPSFAPPVQYPITNDPPKHVVAVTTTTYNSVPYVITVNRSSANVDLFLVNANGTLGTDTVYPLGPGGNDSCATAEAVAAGDLNGDGIPDLVVACAPTPDTVPGVGGCANVGSIAVLYGINNDGVLVFVSSNSALETNGSATPFC